MYLFGVQGESFPNHPAGKIFDDGYHRTANDKYQRLSTGDGYAEGQPLMYMYCVQGVLNESHPTGSIAGNGYHRVPNRDGHWLSWEDGTHWILPISDVLFNPYGEIYQQTPNNFTCPHGPHNVHPPRLSCRDGTMYTLFPGAPHSVIGYHLKRWHDSTGFLRPSQFKDYNQENMWLSLGDVADRVGYIPTLGQEGWIYYILALIDNVYSVNGHRHADNGISPARLSVRCGSCRFRRLVVCLWLYQITR